MKCCKIFKMKKFIKEVELEISNFKPISANLQDLAIIKHVLIKLSNICSRDDRFFLYKENIYLRRKIYNKNLKFNKKGMKVSCKSYCNLVKNILSSLNIKTSLFSAGTDEFKHYALLYENKNKKYYIDPLHDLVNFKVGSKAEYFCCEYHKISNLTILSESQQDEINNAIKYKEIYRDKLNCILHEIKQSDVCLVLKVILKNLNLISISDNITLLNKAIQDSALQDYKNNIQISYCITKKSFSLDNTSLIKKRCCGIYIKYNNEIIYFFPSIKCFLQNPLDVNFVYVKPKVNLKTYQYLRENNVNRQILDNVYFQKVFYIIEKEYNINENDIEILHNNILIEKLNLKFCIYKSRYLCVIINHKIYYYKIKNFGESILKKELKSFNRKILLKDEP